MSVERYWSLSIEVPRQRFEALSVWLCELGFPSFEERSTPRGVAALVYASDPGALERLENELQRAAAAAGAALGELGFRRAEVPAGWALEWTRHLKPVSLTPSLTLYPHRPERSPAPGELYLEPAFAFGFGEHESTRLAARWLEVACRNAPGASVLDVGCGTGVLALVASRSGAARVLGIDISTEAVAAARDNALLNGIERGVAFESIALDQVTDLFELVVANVEAGVSSELASAISERVAPGGALALSGFIREQCDDLVRRYGAQGLTLERRDTEGEWCLLVAEKPDGQARQGELL